jgi:hypothetical protein
MPDQTRANDPGAIWRNQPEEKTTVDLQKIVNRRTKELQSSTRSEILMSFGAALLFVAVMVWRFPPTHNPIQELGFAAVLVWIVISLYRFRHQLWQPDSSPADSVAATGLEYYRQELEQRRDHLRNSWLWHGPLSLACMIVVASLVGKTFPRPEHFKNVLPLVVLLLVWIAFGLKFRRRQANELQREIDEIEPLGTSERFERK